MSYNPCPGFKGSKDDRLQERISRYESLYNANVNLISFEALYKLSKAVFFLVQCHRQLGLDCSVRHFCNDVIYNRFLRNTSRLFPRLVPLLK